MARIGGRRLWLAWPVGVLCAAVVAGLVWLAAPGLPAIVAFGDGMVRGPAAPTQADAGDGMPRECRSLYTDALWAGLNWTDGSTLAETSDAPVSTASDLMTALAPEVRFTCEWSTSATSITTTLADVGVDAGAIAQASLPGLGFACAAVDTTRLRCERIDGDLHETLEFGAGVLLATTEVGWHPERYAARVADQVWAR